MALGCGAWKNGCGVRCGEERNTMPRACDARRSMTAGAVAGEASAPVTSASRLALTNVHGRAGRQHRIGASLEWMAVAWINNLDVDLEAGGPIHDAGHSCGFVPLKVRAGGKPKALPATRMIDDVRRDANGFVAVCIVVRDDPDISRQTDAAVDGAPS